MRITLDFKERLKLCRRFLTQKNKPALPAQTMDEYFHARRGIIRQLRDQDCIENYIRSEAVAHVGLMDKTG